MKYAGLGFQLFVLLLIGAFIGKKIDHWLNTDKPYFTALVILLFTGGFFYKLYLDLTRKPNA